MLKFRSVFFFIFLSLSGFSQSPSVKEAWVPLLKMEGLAEYFSGLYERLGIEIEETGEKITVVHKGSYFELEDGVENVDYLVELKLENIKNMSSHGEDGKIDAYESYRIMSVLFTPLTKASLENPMMNKPFQQKLAGIENHVHVYLESPTNDEYVAHTLIFLNKQWMVIKGIHGAAKRIFRMSPDQAVTYQKEVFKAQKAGTRKAWRKFKKFYLDWRKDVSKEVCS